MANTQRHKGKVSRVHGKAVRAEAGVVCCCQGDTYVQLCDCDTDTLQDLWAIGIADGTYLKQISDGLCYYQQADDPTTTDPGTILGEYKEITDCSDDLCVKCGSCTDKGTPDEINLSFNVTYCGCATHLKPDQPLGTYTLPETGPGSCFWHLFIPDWGTYGGACGADPPFTATLDLNASRSGGQWIVSAIMGGSFELFRGTSAAVANCNTPTGVPGDANDGCAEGSVHWAPGGSAFISPA